jgi:photosystem II stability/assembly factor-like uncharacterized protein
MKTIFTCLILFLSGTFIFPQSGWFWQNPKPQGNPLHDVFFTDDTNGWAVGDLGSILYTRDQGTTWLKQKSSTDNILYAVYFRLPDDGWVVGQAGTILHWNGETWSSQNSGFEGHLFDVHFVNSQMGWAVGQDETVLYTSNAGEIWNRLTPEGPEHYFSVSFVNENEGYLCGAAGNNGVVKYTENGGETWNIEIIPANRMNAIFFADENAGWAVGDNGAIFHKAHADSSWVIQNCGSTNDLTSVSAINPHQVWVAGKGGIIYHSNNDGETWFPEESKVTDNLSSIFILNGESGWAVGDAGTALYTYNGGGTWLTMNQTGPTGFLRGISFMYPELGMVVGDEGLIYSTLDEGQTWNKDTSGVSIKLWAVDIAKHYVSADRAMAVGYGGTILRKWWEPDRLYEDWELRAYDHNEDLYSIDIRGRDAWAAGQFGSIAYTSNSGNTWEIQHQDLGYHLYDIHFPTPNYGWAVGMSAKILHSQNKGVDWEEQTSPVNTNFQSVCFCDHRTGWAVGIYGEIIHTENGGRNWTEQSSGTTEMLTSVHFTDCNNGWIVGDFGTILHTSNGGETWGKQSSGTSNLLWSVYFADPAHGWIAGDKGTILATKDGGGTTFFLLSPRYELGKPIEDYQVTMDTLTVFEAGGKKSLQAESKLVAVEVIIDTVLHTAVSDLEFKLSHEGVTDTLIFHNGGENADFIDLVLSDASTMSIDSGAAPFSGVFMPYKALSAFAGLDPTGPWVLSIYDAVEGNTGTLNAWSLKLYYEEATVSSVFEPETNLHPEGHVLYQNHPNPFQGQTYISYYLQNNCDVEINVFDFLGKKVATLYKAEQMAGKHQISWDASGYRSGIYILQLKAGTQFLYNKMILVN